MSDTPLTSHSISPEKGINLMVESEELTDMERIENLEYMCYHFLKRIERLEVIMAYNNFSGPEIK